MSTRKRRPAAQPDRWSESRLADLGLSPIQQKILLALGGIVALLVAGLLLSLAVDAINGTAAAPGDSSTGSVIGQARPAEYQSWGTLRQFAPIATRDADPKPITAEEVFSTRTLKTGKLTLKLTERKLDDSCASVFWGEELIEKVAEAGCTQAARGLYTTPDATYIAQYTLLNVTDADTANTLVSELDALHRAGWVLSLQPAKAAFRGYTEASGHAMGHYVGLVWVGRADGAEPEPTDDFVGLGLTLREAEKAVYRRVVAATGGATPSASG